MPRLSRPSSVVRGNTQSLRRRGDETKSLVSNDRFDAGCPWQEARPFACTAVRGGATLAFAHEGPARNGLRGPRGPGPALLRKRAAPDARLSAPCPSCFLGPWETGGGSVSLAVSLGFRRQESGRRLVAFYSFCHHTVRCRSPSASLAATDEARLSDARPPGPRVSPFPVTTTQRHQCTTVSQLCHLPEADSPVQPARAQAPPPGPALHGAP